MSELCAFDPDALAGKDSNLFGLPYTTETARLVVIPVPWEVTVSYSEGTARGPQAIMEASKQIDLFDPELEDAWKIGITMDGISDDLVSRNEEFREKAKRYIDFLSEGGQHNTDDGMDSLLRNINAACQQMNEFVEKRAEELLDQGKLVAVAGGDHSTPLGLLRALGKRHSKFGILHFDAHADLRDAYEDFEYSHASIMFNALEIESLSRLVQVGIRDYCSQEYELVRGSGGRIVSFYDKDIKARMFEGATWRELCDEAIAPLPEEIYVSFDIDGLDPKLCPNTGTPVPGGLEFEQALYMVETAVRSGRKIIGFDVNEVAPSIDESDEWDANVGARLLYRLSNLTFRSQRIKAGDSLVSTSVL